MDGKYALAAGDSDNSMDGEHGLCELKQFGWRFVSPIRIISFGRCGAMIGQHATPTAGLLIVCLCAEWCGVCRDYRERFEQLQAKFAPARFLWIDVEDEADLLHPLDIENFPTLLLAVGNQPRFFGPVTPSIETLERLIRAHMPAQSRGANIPNASEVADLLARVRAEHAIA